MVEAPTGGVPEPVLLVELEPRHIVFFRNLRDLVFPRRLPPLQLTSWPAAPWPDVFVSAGWPWGGFSGSLLCHVVVIAALLSLAELFPERHPVADHPAFNHDAVVYYSPVEYLAPLDTGSAPAEVAQQGDPEFSPQPIISVPPQADNHTQTIVSAPNVKITRDVPLPNIVAWSQTQQADPLGATARPTNDLKAPSLTADVIAPTPEVSRALNHQAPGLSQNVVAPAPEMSLSSSRESIRGPQASVVAPSPQVRAEALRKVGDLNIGHSEVVAPAPQLPVGEQTVSSRTAAAGLGGAAAVPPPPSVQASGSQGAGGRLIALNLRPLAPDAAVAMPAGNRQGTFAATPDGTPGARGIPQIEGRDASSQSAPGGAGTTKGTGAGKGANGAPPGLFVGAAPKGADTAASAGQASSDKPRLLASVTPPRVGSVRPPAEMPDNASPLEHQVFGDRKFYSMSLNMPNLNSSGGSWVVHFAQLKDDGEKGELSAPVATRTADPGYPLELMRHNVQGMVTLYAVIHVDGSVSDVRVLQSIDDDLDRYASAALAKWQFRPATKNGNAVALEAVVMIPFKPMRGKSGF